MITTQERAEIIEWLSHLDVPALTGKSAVELRDASYLAWARSANAWSQSLGAGGTYTMRAVAWYQHVYKPGSTEGRPAVILLAIREHLQEATTS